MPLPKRRSIQVYAINPPVPMTGPHDLQSNGEPRRPNNHQYFDPSLYDERVHEWQRRPFLEDDSSYRIPKWPFSMFVRKCSTFSRKIASTQRRIQQAQARDSEALILTDMVSSRKARVLFSIASPDLMPLDNEQNKISYLDGIYLSKVFTSYCSSHNNNQYCPSRRNDEPKLDMDKCMMEMKAWFRRTTGGQELDPLQVFVYQPQQPTRMGNHNHVVFFAQVNNKSLRSL